MTYEQVTNVFKDDLKQEPCIEVVKTRWGYIRVFYEEPYESSFEAVLCRKPEDLFQELLEIVLAGREDLLLKQSKKEPRRSGAGIEAGSGILYEKNRALKLKDGC